MAVVTALLVAPHLAWSDTPAAAHEPVNLDEPEERHPSPTPAPPATEAAPARKTAASPGTPPPSDLDLGEPSIPESSESPAPTPASARHPTQPVEPPDVTDPGGAQRLMGIEIAGVGVVGILVGSVWGFVAKSKLDQSNAGPCSTDDRCSPRGLSLRQSATDAATVSTIAFVTGIVAIAGGIALTLTAPRSARAITLVVAPTRSGGSALLGTVF